MCRANLDKDEENHHEARQGEAPAEPMREVATHQRGWHGFKNLPARMM